MRNIRFLSALSAMAVAALLLVGGGSATAKPWIGVKGNKLVDRQGNTVRLLGVNRSGTEYRCVKREGFFEGPSDAASIKAMKSWHINVVRVPLNESCWLGINWVPPDFGGTAYRAAVREYVERLERAGLYVILDLHWAAPKTFPAEGLLPLPDAEHAPEFWRSVATEYRDDRSVIFDVYNEPRPGVGWDCWREGCEIDDHWIGRYQAVGLPSLVETIRSTGARQPLMLAGLSWSRNLAGWMENIPDDPADALVASNHSYGQAPCRRNCKRTLEQIARRYPVVTGELGQIDCKHDYISRYMPWADRHGISYLGWAWNTGNGWTCTGGPTLIKDYDGTPTQFGIGFREHLRNLWLERR